MPGLSLPAGIAFCAALVSLLAPGARADDEQGQYAVRGAALISCALFVQARATRDDAYLITASWVDGYITGSNQHAPETYDVLSFESTELLMAVLNEHCEDNPADPVFGVLTSLIDQLWPDRLTEESEKVTVALGDREARHYVALIERMQRELRDDGFYEGAVTGEFTAETVSAIERFQAAVGFEPTGFPDQATLWRLLRAE